MQVMLTFQFSHYFVNQILIIFLFILKCNLVPGLRGRVRRGARDAPGARVDGANGAAVHLHTPVHPRYSPGKNRFFLMLTELL